MPLLFEDFVKHNPHKKAAVVIEIMTHTFPVHSSRLPDLIVASRNALLMKGMWTQIAVHSSITSP
jgi:hypothetical protein